MTHPTPYPEVNAVLHALLKGVQTVLGTQLVGLYLYGSLSSGDFNLETSDIDFVVITEGALNAETVTALEAMHVQIAEVGGKWARKLEGSYIPRADLPRYDPDGGPYPGINEGEFSVGGHGSDWIIQRHILRAGGVAVTGPDIRQWIDPVAPDDLRRAVRGILREWWAPIAADPVWLHERSDYQAFAILTMARALHALHHGDIASKPVAARWARDNLPAPWPALVETALAWHYGVELHLVAETAAFIRYTLARSAAIG